MADSSPIDSLLEHAAFARRLARALVGDESRADDVVQQSWLNALEHPPHSGHGIRNWFATVVRNSAARLRREDSRREARERRAATPESLPSAADVAAQLAAQHALLDAVARLDEPYRSTVHARFFEERTPTQIAATQAIPVRTVETRLRRAIERLRADLDRRVSGGRSAWVGLLVGGTVMATKTKTASAVAVAAIVVATVATLVVVLPQRPRVQEGVARGPLAQTATANATSPASAPAVTVASAPDSPSRKSLSTVVTVLSPDGVEMPGAAVVLFRGDEVLGEATTDEAGSASVPIQDTPCRLLVHPCCAPAKIVDVAAKAESIEVSFDEGAIFSGRVVVDGHAPAAPLELRITSEGLMTALSEMPGPIGMRLNSLRAAKNWELLARTGVDGEFAFYGLAPHARFWVHIPSPYKDAKSGEPEVEIDDACENVELALRFNASIHGRLVDGLGAPLEGWHVEGWARLDAGLGKQPRVESGRDGAFRLFNHQSDASAIRLSRLHVLEPGGAFMRGIDIDGRADGECDVGDVAIDTRRVLALDPRDESGRPIDQLVVVIERGVDANEGHERNPWNLVETLDVVDAARARSGLVLPDPVKSLRVVAPGFVAVDVVPAPAPAPVTVTLPTAASLELDVRDSLGPMPPMTLLEISSAKWPAAWPRDEIIAAHEALGGSPMPWNLSDRREHEVSFELAPAKDGTYRAIALIPGLPITLVVRENFGTELLREEIVLTPGECRKIERRLVRDPVTIQGFVHDVEGKPLPRTRIELRGEHGVDLACTGEDGRFKIDGLRAPRVTFLFKAEQRAWKWLRELDVRAVNGPIDVELKVGVSAECSFFAPYRHPVPTAVWIEPMASRPHPDLSDPPPEGSDRIDAESDGHGIYAFASVPDRSLLRAIIDGITFAWQMVGSGEYLGINATLHGPVEIDWSITATTSHGRTLTALRLLSSYRKSPARATIPIDAAAAALGSGLARIEKVPFDCYTVALVWSDATGQLTEEKTDVEVDVLKPESARVTLVR